MNNDKLAEIIFEVISRQSFADFYLEGKFDSYISGFNEDGVTKEQVIEEIKKLFNLKD